MKFKIGPKLYRVRTSEQKLTDEAGRECNGLCLWSERVIWLRFGMEPELAMDVLFHELAHAWEEAFGVPVGEEGLANRSSTFAMDVWEQFQRQGGAAALARLRPDGVVDRDVQPHLNSTLRGTNCPICMGPISEGDLRKNDSAPYLFGDTDRMAIDREATCSFCNDQKFWFVVSATTTGLPTSSVIEGPHMGPRPREREAG